VKAVVADLQVPVARRGTVVLVVERRQHSSAAEVEFADLKVLLLNKDLRSRRKSCMPNEVDDRKEIHKPLYRAQQGLHRYSVVDGPFGAAFHNVLAEENWFELVQAWNLKECEE
jgi:hypothetical protein